MLYHVRSLLTGKDLSQFGETMSDTSERGSARKTLAGSEEVVAWEFATGYQTTRAALAKALGEHQFDPEEAGVLPTRWGFIRLIRQMSKGKLVRKFEEKDDCLYFQTSAELRTPDWLQYNPETMFRLDKASGKVTATDQEMADWIQSNLEETLEVRNNADVNRMLQRLCEDGSRLWPVKHMSGVFLALPRDREFLTRLGSLVKAIGGILRRLPVDHTNPVGSSTVAEIIASAAATEEEGAEMLPVAESDQWPERTLRSQLTLVQTTQRDLLETIDRLHKSYERLAEHNTWLTRLIGEASVRNEEVSRVW